MTELNERWLDEQGERCNLLVEDATRLDASLDGYFVDLVENKFQGLD